MPLSIVTGAFSFSGRYIARRLVAQGEKVRTLTSHSDPRDPLFPRLEIAPLDFSRPDELARSLAGAEVLYNTYWVRFPRGGTTHEQAVANTRTLLAAAEQAGIGRIVQLSVSNPSPESRLSYFRGKAMLEQAIRESRLSWAIVRPALIFAREDILINNIAWLLRRFPLFAIPGDGRYRVQPIFVEDLAALAVEAGARNDNLVMDAVGPEIFTYEEFVRRIAAAVGSRARLLHLGPGLVTFLSGLLGLMVGDVLLTRAEVDGLMQDLLVSSQLPNAPTRFSEWLQEHAAGVGARYMSEFSRHWRR